MESCCFCRENHGLKQEGVPMIREVSLEEISDGRLYGLNDMVRADCRDCEGCSSCCQGMGSSIVLDPLDVHRLEEHLGEQFKALLTDRLELNVVDGVILPNLKMSGKREACTFLDGGGRCEIHPFRPGICRLFPLGRFYENRGFQYFLQIHECRMENRTKVKVRKWIDTPDLKQYERFVSEWHYFLKDLQARLEDEKSDELTKQASMFVLNTFYMTPFEKNRDFYEQFEERMKPARSLVI